MKKYMSIMMLAARGSLYKALGAMILMGLAQVGVYYAALRSALADREAELQEQLLHPEYGTWDIPYPTLETILEEGLLSGWITIATIWIVGFVLVAYLLATAGNPLKGGNSSTRLTIQRMPMREWKISLCYAVYNFAVMIIFWAFSILVALLICKLYYDQADPNSYGSQSVFLMFYRNDLMHGLLPLAETLKYIRNIVLFAATGVMASSFDFWNRRGKRNFWTIIVFLVIAAAIPKGLGTGGSDVMWTVVFAFAAGAEIYRMASQLEDGDQA